MAHFSLPRMVLADVVEHPLSGGTGIGSGVVAFLLTVLAIVAVWKVYVKAGEPGWASIIPFYNMIVLLKIAGKPLWWFVLLLVPVVNFFVLIAVCVGLAERFGKGAGFGIGLALLPIIFYPMLGFGSATYQAR